MKEVMKEQLGKEELPSSSCLCHVLNLEETNNSYGSGNGNGNGNGDDSSSPHLRLLASTLIPWGPCILCGDTVKHIPKHAFESGGGRAGQVA
ncbi:hypothetical protein TIFTF001_031713 [Ficus carica]|uniref:Uncharacterized protein n=1 Tax=Ficus carica TaxID=3494 RepID=A0AA88J5T8_FICCA|nr:hypothetical protein TIFTF001_031713 [Ficus carica]